MPDRPREHKEIEDLRDLYSLARFGSLGMTMLRRRVHATLAEAPRLVTVAVWHDKWTATDENLRIALANYRAAVGALGLPPT